MKNINTSSDWLKVVLESRKEKNPSYSSRALARDLNISQTLISLIMSGQRPLSKKVALKIAPGLGLAPEEEQLFLQSASEEQVIRKMNRKNVSKKYMHRMTVVPSEMMMTE